MQVNKWVNDDLRFQKYIQNLKKQGLILHKSLVPAWFRLNNGLQYPGLRVKQYVKGQQNLVLVPIKLLLTAHKAVQQPQLKQIFQEKFYHQGNVSQDRLLITYLLYLYQKYTENKISQLDSIRRVWAEMVAHFSQDIDILSFWPNQQLKKFKDSSVQNGAILELKNFQNQWEDFSEIRDNHELLRKQIFNKQNYKWIYIHTVSRCFGSFMNSTYFTPYCEFFNHHCVDVSYNCATKEQFQNTQKQRKQKEQLKQTQKKTQKKTQNQQQKSQTSSISSISSGNSLDYIQQGDFNYWQIQTYKINWCGKICFDLKDKQKKHIQQMHKDCLSDLNQKIVWKGFNLVFIGQLIQKINIIKNQYMAGRKKFIQSKQQFQKVKLLIQNYKKQLTQFYRKMGAKYYNIKNDKEQTNSTKQQSQDQSKLNKIMEHQDNYKKTTKPPQKDYLYFKMQTRSKAQFHQNQQIYFSYGKNSNRTLLIRYGFCIEDNVYDHVWIKLSMNKSISPYPDLLDSIQQKGLPITNKIKIRPTVFCYELYLWLKIQKYQLAKQSLIDLFYVTNLNKQILIFSQIIPILTQRLQHYKSYPDYDNLTDPQIGYHQYFTRVYHLEKVKILLKNIQIINFVIFSLNQMLKKKKIIQLEGNYKKQLKGYWRILKKGMIF